MNYLDYNGLKEFWNCLNNHVIFFGTCNTISNVQEKSVRVGGLMEYVEGTRVVVKFANPNTHATPTLEVSSETLPANISNAYPIIDEEGNTISQVNAGTISGYCEFVYDGDGHWVITSNKSNKKIIFTETNEEPDGEEGMIWLKSKDAV